IAVAADGDFSGHVVHRSGRLELASGGLGQGSLALDGGELAKGAFGQVSVVGDSSIVASTGSPVAIERLEIVGRQTLAIGQSQQALNARAFVEVLTVDDLQ